MGENVNAYKQMEGDYYFVLFSMIFNVSNELLDAKNIIVINHIEGNNRFPCYHHKGKISEIPCLQRGFLIFWHSIM